MKYLLLLLLLPFTLHAQQTLNFDKDFIHSEDTWVAFPPKADSSHVFGFIYMDDLAGLTFDLKGTFKIAPDGKFIATPIEQVASMKTRLQPNRVKVALIPESRFEELKIKATPEWLIFYKRDSTSISHFYWRGFQYNAFGASDKALAYLTKAKEINVDYPGVRREMAYAYNALSQFDKAISTINEAFSKNDKDCALYKELSYAQIQLKLFDEAEKTTEKGILNCNNNTLKCEMAFNMTAIYFNKKDKEKSSYWISETKKWGETNNDIFKTLSKIEAIVATW